MDKVVKWGLLFPMYMLMRILKVPMFWKQIPIFRKYEPAQIDYVVLFSFLMYFLVGLHTLWIGAILYAIVIYITVYVTKDVM
jgi:hypothetical protein